MKYLSLIVHQEKPLEKNYFLNFKKCIFKSMINLAVEKGIRKNI